MLLLFPPNHSSVACTAPHLKCTEVDCFVPSCTLTVERVFGPPAARIKRLLAPTPLSSSIPQPELNGIEFLERA